MLVPRLLVGAGSAGCVLANRLTEDGSAFTFTNLIGGIVADREGGWFVTCGHAVVRRVFSPSVADRDFAKPVDKNKGASALLVAAYSGDLEGGLLWDVGVALGVEEPEQREPGLVGALHRDLPHGAREGRIAPRDGRMAFVKSPDNVSIELLQEGEPLATVEPWLSMENTGSW